MERLLSRLEGGLRAGYPGVVINGADAQRLPQTANIAFPGHDGQMLLMALDLAGVACSVGAACSSGSAELSPTLRAMGFPRRLSPARCVSASAPQPRKAKSTRQSAGFCTCCEHSTAPRPLP